MVNSEIVHKVKYRLPSISARSRVSSIVIKVQLLVVSQPLAGDSSTTVINCWPSAGIFWSSSTAGAGRVIENASAAGKVHQDKLISTSSFKITRSEIGIFYRYIRKFKIQNVHCHVSQNVLKLVLRMRDQSSENGLNQIESHNERSYGTDSAIVTSLIRTLGGAHRKQNITC